MNVRLQSIKALSILLLLSVSASYSMHNAQRIWNQMPQVPAYIQLGISGVAIAAGLGTLAYKSYIGKSSEALLETPAQVNEVSGTKAKSKKQVNWPEDKNLNLTQVHEFPKDKTLSFDAELHKIDLAQQKRKPSGRKSRAKSVAASPEQIRQFDAILADLATHQVQATIERSEATISNTREQIRESEQLIERSQAQRLALEALNKRAEAEKREKRKAINFHTVSK